jgi:hypothetical protein
VDTGVLEEHTSFTLRIILTGKYKHFGRICFCHFKFKSVMKLEAAIFPKWYPCTILHTGRENHSLNTSCHENPKSVFHF